MLAVFFSSLVGELERGHSVWIRKLNLQSLLFLDFPQRLGILYFCFILSIWICERGFSKLTFLWILLLALLSTDIISLL